MQNYVETCRIMSKVNRWGGKNTNTQKLHKLIWGYDKFPVSNVVFSVAPF